MILIVEKGEMKMHYLLMDSYVLLSIVNMKLRDFYSSLDDLCDDMNINREKLERKLSAISYQYKMENNQFVGQTNLNFENFE
jgi:hypothetical protein